MDKAKYEQALSIFSKARLDKSLKEMMSVAEDAWFAQAQAIRAIDHRNDEVAGEDRIVDLKFALEQWILELEIIANAATKIAKRANKTLYTRGDYPEAEDDGEGYGDDAEGVEVAEEYVASGSSDRAGSGRRNKRRRVVGDDDSGVGQAVRQKAQRCAQKRREVSRRGN